MSEATSPVRTAHLRSVVAVFVGGAIGTLLRTFIVAHVTIGYSPSSCDQTSGCATVAWHHYLPWSLLAINVIGVYGATRLLAGPLRERGFFDQWRLLVITGFFGGLTSYSSLYIALGAMWHSNAPATAFAGLSAVLSGVAAAWFAVRNVR